MLQTTEKLPALQEFLYSHSSECTRKAYTNDLRQFEEFLLMMGTPLRALVYGHALAFKEMLSRKYATGSVNRKLNTVKCYFKFICIRGLLERNPFEYLECIPGRTAVPTPALSDEEVVKILSAVDTSTLRGSMASAILHCLFYLGLRRSEVCALKMGSIGASQGIPTLSVLGKGNKARTVPLIGPVFDAISAYLSMYSRAKYTGNAQDPLFFGRKMGHLHPNSVVKMLQKHAKKAGIDRQISPHMARTTCVSNALESGASPIQVQYLCGWSSLDMVLGYERRRQELKNSAVHKISYGKK